MSHLGYLEADYYLQSHPSPPHTHTPHQEGPAQSYKYTSKQLPYDLPNIYPPFKICNFNTFWRKINKHFYGEMQDEKKNCNPSHTFFLLKVCIGDILEEKGKEVEQHFGTETTTFKTCDIRSEGDIDSRYSPLMLHRPFSFISAFKVGFYLTHSNPE